MGGFNPYGYSDDGDTPEEVKRKRALANVLSQQGMSAEPVGHWMQALARVFQAGTGGYMGEQARLSERAGQARAGDALTKALTGADPSGAIAEGMRTPYGPSMLGPMAGHAVQSRMQEMSPGGQLDLRLKKAQIAQLEQKDAMEQMLLREFGGPARGSSAAPSVAAPAPASPTTPSMPGVVVAPPTTAAAPSPATAASPMSVRELFASRSPAERMMFLATYKKDPAAAAKILKDWADPQHTVRLEADKERGKLQGQVQANLPNAVAASDRLLEQLDSVLKDKNLSAVTGPIQGSLPTIRGKSIDTVERIKQIQGTLFMKAYQTLKGGGPITDVEGLKATQSLARLNNLKQSDKGYVRALQEAIRDVEVLRNRDAAELAKMQGALAPAPTTAGADGFSIRRLD